MSFVRVTALMRTIGQETSESRIWPCQAGRPIRVALSFDGAALGFAWVCDLARFAMKASVDRESNSNFHALFNPPELHRRRWRWRKRAGKGTKHESGAS